MAENDLYQPPYTFSTSSLNSEQLCLVDLWQIVPYLLQCEKLFWLCMELSKRFKHSWAHDT